MALTVTPLPFGLRDIKITPYTDAAGTILASTSIDLPNARTLSFSDSEDFEELRGDDRLVASHGSGPQVEWELESGGLPFEAFKAMAGGTIEESGSTPAQKKVFSKKATDIRPYFLLEGQVISDSGGDVHCVLYRCKATGELSGEFSDGSFFLTSASGVALAVPSGVNEDKIYDFVQNETAVAIPTAGPLPTISTVTPSGAAESETVTVVGTGFTGATAVTFDGDPGTNLDVVNDTVLTVDLPAGSAGSVPVVVTTPAGDSSPFSYTRGA